MDFSEEQFDLLFETSWEVCNKIGGIYTVLSTKAQTLQKAYKDKVIFIGPDVWTVDSPSPFFKETPALLKKWQANTGLPEGVKVRVGRWEVPGRPVVVLVDFKSMYASNNELFGKMWELYGVDSLHAYGDYDEACAFSHAAALVIESLCRFHGLEGKRYIAHFDEWTTGMGLLHVKWQLPQIATIFTTHATSIGRSICGNNKALYEYLPGYNGDQMAAELNMESKHSLEKAAAMNADCFTTVSRVTARECEQLLDRRPDVVTPNGFEENFVPGPRSIGQARMSARSRILEVAAALTGVALPEDTFIVATSGRNEYRNKGLDMYLDAVSCLGELDPRGKVLALVLVPAWVREPRPELAAVLAAGHSSQGLKEPVITHYLNNADNDAVLNRIRSLNFTNDERSRVQIVYVPCYLNGDDGIFNMSYYELLPGLDATVFPSYYEPWGYTPLESVAFGVPTVTTTLSGFGQWILSKYANGFESCGVDVITRGDFNYDQVKEDIALALRDLTLAPAPEKKKISNAARNTAKDASWDNFIVYYEEAFAVALEHAAKRCPSASKKCKSAKKSKTK